MISQQRAKVLWSAGTRSRGGVWGQCPMSSVTDSVDIDVSAAGAVAAVLPALEAAVAAAKAAATAVNATAAGSPVTPGVVPAWTQWYLQQGYQMALPWPLHPAAAWEEGPGLSARAAATPSPSLLSGHEPQPEARGPPLPDSAAVLAWVRQCPCAMQLSLRKRMHKLRLVVLVTRWLTLQGHRALRVDPALECLSLPYLEVCVVCVVCVCPLPQTCALHCLALPTFFACLSQAAAACLCCCCCCCYCRGWLLSSSWLAAVVLAGYTSASTPWLVKTWWTWSRSPRWTSVRFWWEPWGSAWP